MEYWSTTMTNQSDGVSSVLGENFHSQITHVATKPSVSETVKVPRGESRVLSLTMNIVGRVLPVLR